MNDFEEYIKAGEPGRREAADKAPGEPRRPRTDFLQFAVKPNISNRYTESRFAKYRRCSRWVLVVSLVGFLLCCWQLLLLTHVKQLGLYYWYSLNKILSVLFIIVNGINLVLIFLMSRYVKCPHCGKSILSKWWNYGRIKRICKCKPVICPHCGEEVETA